MIEHIEQHILKLIIVIVDRSKLEKVTDVMEEMHSHFQIVCLARGTAGQDIMNLLGLGSADKAVMICLEPEFRVKPIMSALNTALQFNKPGNGIAMTLPLSGVSSRLFHLVSDETREKLASAFEKEMDKLAIDAKFDLILSVINQGYSEELMEAAKEAGARGGTVLHARRIGLEEAVKLWGISIQSEKEIVAILATRTSKQDIMKAISNVCGFNSPAKGMILALPVESMEGVEFV